MNDFDQFIQGIVNLAISKYPDTLTENTPDRAWALILEYVLGEDNMINDLLSLTQKAIIADIERRKSNE